MNVSIITCSCANNYGAILQTYALYYYIRELGHDVEVIDYRPSYLECSIRQWYNARFDLKEWCKVILRWNERSRLISKNRKIKAFAKENLRFSSRVYHSVQELSYHAPNSDIYIAGSDQIWNPMIPNGSDSAFFLDFGSSATKRISYAASFAVNDIPESRRCAIWGSLHKLDKVSIRERSGLKICNELGIDATLVCDPTLLCSYDFWIRKADYSCVPHSRYLLVYDFMKSDEVKNLSKRIASQKNLKIVSISPFYLNYAHRNFCDCTPQQFLALIDKSEYVIGNSLHGCIFSVIFRKEFFVVSRIDGLNARMHDFLERYSLLCRMDPGDILSPPIDYERVYLKLRTDIDFSKLWLNHQLN